MASPKKSDPKKDPKFQSLVQTLLKTPPRPRKQKRGKAKNDH